MEVSRHSTRTGTGRLAGHAPAVAVPSNYLRCGRYRALVSVAVWLQHRIRVATTGVTRSKLNIKQYSD